MAAEKKPKKNVRLDIYRNHHRWDTTRVKRTLDPELVDYYINNDLDLSELYDDMKLYDYASNRAKYKRKK